MTRVAPSANGAADAVRAACARSLAAPGVRIYVTTVRETESGLTQATRWEVGVADPAARRVALEGFVMADDPTVQRIKALARQAARDRPELLAQDPWVGAGPHPDGERILIGPRVFSRSRAGWMLEPERALWAIDGLWALEALTGIHVARAEGDTEVRGERCRRYIGEVQPGSIADRAGIQLVQRLASGDDYYRMLADVSVGADGLIRRVACAPTTGRRFTPGVVLKALSWMAPSPGGAQVAPVDDDRRPWTVIEFWDYGLPVEITAPAALTKPASTSEFIAGVWRARRQRKPARRTNASSRQVRSDTPR